MEIYHLATVESNFRELKMICVAHASDKLSENRTINFVKKYAMPEPFIGLLFKKYIELKS